MPGDVPAGEMRLQGGQGATATQFAPLAATTLHGMIIMRTSDFVPARPPQSRHADPMHRSPPVCKGESRMKRTVVLLFALVLLLACGAPPAPTPDLAATRVAQAMAATMAAAAPTITGTPAPVPVPTHTPSPPQPTVTLALTPEATVPFPVPTHTPGSPKPTVTLALTPETAVPSSGTAATTDVPLTADLVEEAERLWEASGVTHYRIQIREVHSTWCYYEISLEVQNEEIVTGTITAHYGPARGCWAYTNGAVEEPVSLAPAEAARWTVPGLFKIAHEWVLLVGPENMRILLRFDTELGYPLALYRNKKEVHDDDMWLETLQFDPL